MPEQFREAEPSRALGEDEHDGACDAQLVRADDAREHRGHEHDEELVGGAEWPLHQEPAAVGSPVWRQQIFVPQPM